MSDLKKQNEKQLMSRLLVAVAPIYISLVILHGDSLLEIAHSRPWRALGQMAALGAGPVLCLKVLLSLLASAVSTHWKERLVHFRWTDPLPGSRSDKLLRRDPRIEQSNLPPEVLALMSDSLTPPERNARWYRDIYRPVSGEPAVLNSHREYLLNRDATAGVFLLLVVAALIDVLSRVFFETPLMLALAYVSFFIYLLLLATAANLAGNRMVTGAISNFSNSRHTGGEK